MSARRLHDHLNAQDSLANLASHVRQIARVQRAYEKFLPTELTEVSRVLNVKQGVVVVSASSGAVAHRLKQLLPSARLARPPWMRSPARGFQSDACGDERRRANDAMLKQATSTPGHHSEATSEPISHCPITGKAPCWFMAEFFVLRPYRRPAFHALTAAIVFSTCACGLGSV